jgi:hypothetical protein
MRARFEDLEVLSLPARQRAGVLLSAGVAAFNALVKEKGVPAVVVPGS